MQQMWKFWAICQNCRFSEQNGRPGRGKESMEQEAVMSGKYVRVDDVMELINTSNRGTCDYFIVDQIEELCRSEKIYDPDNPEPYKD